MLRTPALGQTFHKVVTRSFKLFSLWLHVAIYTLTLFIWQSSGPSLFTLAYRKQSRTGPGAEEGKTIKNWSRSWGGPWNEACILSRSREEKSGEGLGSKLRHRPEMVESVSTNRVHVTYWPSPLFPVCDVVLIPGLLPIFLHGCDIKSGRGLGTRLPLWSQVLLGYEL